MLEIGCGWGGFAEFAAREIGARVTGITISPAQQDFARKRLFDQGLAERADIRLMDYRDVEGQFDHVASIEMFEAVGEAIGRPTSARSATCSRPAAAPGCRSSPSATSCSRTYRSRSDFHAQKYIFPGGMLPSEARLRQETDRAGLEWTAIVRFGQNYADTLAQWTASFESAWDEIRRLGLRRALPPAVALLPQLLRGRLPHRAHQRRPARSRQELRAHFPCAVARRRRFRRR